MYDPPCLNNSSKNLLGRSFFCSLITNIYYIHNYTLLQCDKVWLMLRRMWCHHFHSILIPLCLKQIHLCMILHVLIIAVQICWGDLFSVHSLLFITYNYIILQCDKVWLMLRRMWSHYFHRILISCCLKQIHLCMILHVPTIALEICGGDFLLFTHYWHGPILGEKYYDIF